MARAALFSRDQLLNAAEELIAEGGPTALTIDRLTSTTGASTGSVYHRFQSRSVLSAELWIRAVDSFWVGLERAVELPDPLEAAVEGALHTVTWSRENPRAARMLLICTERDLVADDLPEEWRRRAAEANGRLLASLRGVSRRLYGTAQNEALQRVSLGVIDLPRGAVHRHLLARREIPTQIEVFLAGAVRAVLKP
jgi:AcrR family transcriptional regulator